MIINIITSMPGILDALNHGVIGHAIKQQIITINIVSIRDFSSRDDKRIDDRPYGGGPGMVLEAEPLYQALQSISSTEDSYTIEMCPQGQPLSREILTELSPNTSITIICGRYEGIDHRLQSSIDQKISIGDYVLSGGEIPAMVLVDALARLQPGTIAPDSIAQDSFEDQLLDHAHFTRPETWRGQSVPSVLLSGNHPKIAEYRLAQSLGNTWLNRPDLLLNRPLSDKELKLLIEFLTH